MNPPASNPSPPSPTPPSNRPGPAAPVPPDSATTKPLTVSIVRKPGAPGTPIATGTSAGLAGKTAAAQTASPDSAEVISRPGLDPGPESESSPVPTPAAPRRRSATDRIAAWMAQPVIAVPAAIACLSVLGWSVFIRRTAHPIVAHARPNPAAAISAPRFEEVTDLARQAAVASSCVVTNVDRLPRLISQLEQQARAAGFIVEVTTHPPQSPIPGVPGLARHPIVFNLENASDRDEPAYHRLLGWLHNATTIGVKIDPGAITLQSSGLGLSIATVELGLLSLSPHAKTPSE